MKKNILLILAMSLILCSCFRENTTENISENTGGTTAYETSQTDGVQVFTGIADEVIEYGFSPQVNKNDFS